jgi:hypothetical protein
MVKIAPGDGMRTAPPKDTDGVFAAKVPVEAADRDEREQSHLRSDAIEYSPDGIGRSVPIPSEVSIVLDAG